MDPVALRDRPSTGLPVGCAISNSSQAAPTPTSITLRTHQHLIHPLTDASPIQSEVNMAESNPLQLVSDRIPLAGRSPDAPLPAAVATCNPLAGKSPDAPSPRVVLAHDLLEIAPKAPLPVPVQSHSLPAEKSADAPFLLLKTPLLAPVSVGNTHNGESSETPSLLLASAYRHITVKSPETSPATVPMRGPLPKKSPEAPSLVLGPGHRSVGGKSLPGSQSSTGRPIQRPLSKTPRNVIVSDRVLSGRVQKPSRRAGKPPARKRPQEIIKVTSNTPSVFNKTRTFPWGATQFTYPNGSIGGAELADEPLETESYCDIFVEAVTIEQFKIVALVGNDIKNLFPGANEGYWRGILKWFQIFEQTAGLDRTNEKANAEYYNAQLNLIRGIYPTLEKSITGYKFIHKRLGNNRFENKEFSSLHGQMWALSYHTENLSSLRLQYLRRSSTLRRFHFALSQTALPLVKCSIPGLLKMSQLAYCTAADLQRLIDMILEVRKFIVENLVAPSEEQRKFFAGMAKYKMMARKGLMAMFEPDASISDPEKPQIVVSPVKVMTLPT
ncbi:hypothetical protein TWF718_010472 [Orbilia javanica]|uniref:Uncharacterized protein n=1 Tax=Orbilia javanica TaxID=47235 RepID=A0AAN8MPB4_9PEZI